MNRVYPVYIRFTRHSFVLISLTRMSFAAYLLIHISPSGVLRFEVPAKNDRKRSKADALLEEGTLNPAPEKVRDPKFWQGEFFDPRDAVQVKYEMLRRVSIENASVTDASDEYGVSRPTYYQAKANFDEAGVAGLVPKKRGPHGPHKIHGEVLMFLRGQLVPGEPIRARELARLIRQEFDLDVHPRTIERVVSPKKTLR
jgi:transposase